MAVHMEEDHCGACAAAPLSIHLRPFVERDDGSGYGDLGQPNLCQNAEWNAAAIAHRLACSLGKYACGIQGGWKPMEGVLIVVRI